ncbi:MAG: dihydropyrimidinase [Chloroflexota bacterium]|nr:dihydropyrimidinase [Chloroflexota bacterium]
MGTLFKGGMIVTASDTLRADVLVEGEKITTLGVDLSPDGHTVIDCTGKLLMPGGIDVHTHLDLAFGGTYSNDDFDSGHKAAAFGGTTTHIDFAIQPKGGSLHDALDIWRDKAKLAQIDYGFHLAIIDLRDDVLDEIPSLVQEGVTTLKLFMAYKNVFQVDDRTLYRAMEVAAKHGMIVMVHAENGDVEEQLRLHLLADGKVDPIWHYASRPPEIEGEATNRAVVMAGLTGCALYVVHMTCEQSIAALRRGRALGYPVMGETCVQYVHITREHHLGAPGFEGAKYVCSPPVRDPEHHAAVWSALRDGTLQVVSTDHCDFWYEGGVGPWQAWSAAHNGGDWAAFEAQDPTYRRPGKELGKGNFSKIPNGLPAIEDRMMVMWHLGVNSGKISPSRFVELNCTNPARIFGMYPRKGTLAVGADADIVVWNPNALRTLSASTHHMRTDYNLFEGMEVQGAPSMVFQRGVKLVDGDQWHGQNGAGQYVWRAPNAAVV